MIESKQVGDLKASTALAEPSFPAGLGAPAPDAPPATTPLNESEAAAARRAPKSYLENAPRKKLVIERKSPRTRFRGVPPPLTFDIYALPDTTRLDETEAAAALRRAKSCLENWRKDPKHPLTWKLVAGRILYDLPPIRALLNGNSL